MKTYTPPPTDRDYLDHIERRHQRVYPWLYRPSKERDNDRSRDMLPRVLATNAEVSRCRSIACREGCCGNQPPEAMQTIGWTDADGIHHTRERATKWDGFCWSIRGMCPRIDEAARAVRFCESLIEYLDLLNIEVQTEEVCLPE